MDLYAPASWVVTSSRPRRVHIPTTWSRANANAEANGYEQPTGKRCRAPPSSGAVFARCEHMWATSARHVPMAHLGAPNGKQMSTIFWMVIGDSLLHGRRRPRTAFRRDVLMVNTVRYRLVDARGIVQA